MRIQASMFQRCALICGDPKAMKNLDADYWLGITTRRLGEPLNNGKQEWAMDLRVSSNQYTSGTFTKHRLICCILRGEIKSTADLTAARPFLKWVTPCALAAINTKAALLASQVAIPIHMRTFIARISAKLIIAQTPCVSPATKTRLQRKIISVQHASLMLR